MSGLTATLTGAGILTFALFPLAIPILVLTAALLAPLLLLGIMVAVAIAISVALARVVCALVSRTRQPSGSPDRGARRAGGLELEQPVGAADHRNGDVEDVDPVGAEEGPDLGRSPSSVSAIGEWCRTTIRSGQTAISCSPRSSTSSTGRWE